MPSSTNLIHSRKALHMPGHCHPPDHKRTLQPESWGVGITDISPLLLFHKTNANPTSTIVPPFLGPPWLARPGHLHPFVHRLTKGPHTYIDHLIGCAFLLVAQNFSVTPRPDALCVVTSMVYHPTAAISARDTSNRCLWTQRTNFTPRTSSVVQFVVAWASATSHIQMVPIADWALAKNWVYGRTARLIKSDWSGSTHHLPDDSPQSLPVGVVTLTCERVYSPTVGSNLVWKESNEGACVVALWVRERRGANVTTIRQDFPNAPMYLFL
ncbi:uncharacterized protein LACBIDRAFT_329101 [Laccaria bicolor S238N-H82]|uniref:Predicted protein n=1 Tax=Laccaria bicolor (strain S238N-H82 / ATCC MYA-4686) TaxID=486041 RepID=B0DH32_LACBS|nr:uncharacterized protein LACBIDRAFT_329101 [Laccaria bicolor S238N-H82]EDR05942.1 predicted protein [Laccaria bicolor S238N-H82]|eukprot:XP_001883230.1 predicted protein [Laccaria bicolor S238N-H82]